MDNRSWVADVLAYGRSEMLQHASVGSTECRITDIYQYGNKEHM